MCKKILTLMLVLFLTSTSFAAVGQLQGFGVGAGNVVGVAGIGSAEGGNAAAVGQAQKAFDLCSGTIGIQEETGVLAQSASAVAVGGAAGVVQGAEAGGVQGQLGTDDLLVGGERLGVGLGQGAMSAGPAIAVGGQGFVGGQTQIIANPNGVVANSQWVGTAQFAGVATGPCSSTAFAANELDVNMGQVGGAN